MKQRNTPIIKATIWFEVRDEANKPIATNTAPSNIKPR
jgi:hypothetical protein